MNRLKILIIIPVFYFFNMSILFAQSDYEIVSNFKKSLQQVETKIENVESTSQLIGLNKEIDQVVQKYREHKTLLDKSLYPEDFNSSIENLRTKLNLKENDFTQIDELKSEVVTLRMDVDSLKRKNSEILNQLNTLERISKQDKSRIAQLEKNIAELRRAMQVRDELVMNMIDSLMPPSMRYDNDLSSQEKQEIYSETKRKNIVANIKSAIRDNIKFLEITTLTSDDIKEVKSQQEEFARVWRSSGPKIVEIYAEKGENTNHLAEIDSAFTRWNDAIEDEAWGSIYEKFQINDIGLNKFSDGESFVQSVTAYIDEQIKKENTKENYSLFIDSVWNSSIEPEWIPFLTRNNMITDDQVDRIESKIDEWNEEEKPAEFNWLWIVIALLVIALVVVLIVKRKPNEPPVRSEQTEENI